MASKFWRQLNHDKHTFLLVAIFPKPKLNAYALGSVILRIDDLIIYYLVRNDWRFLCELEWIIIALTKAKVWNEREWLKT